MRNLPCPIEIKEIPAFSNDSQNPLIDGIDHVKITILVSIGSTYLTNLQFEVPHQ